MSRTGVDGDGSHGRGCMGRRITVTISSIVTVVLFTAYCIADVEDMVPGILTSKPVSAVTFPQTVAARTGDGLVASADLGRSIDSAQAQRLVTDLLSADGVGHDVSVIIQDAQGHTAAEHAASTPREPASTLKTLTALAASSTLDMASTLDTQTYISEDSGDTVVTLKGNGDMLLSAGQSDPDHINGRAGLATLAQATAAALAQRGIGSVSLHYDDTLFGDSRIPQGLASGDSVQTDYTMYYTPVSSMAIDGGRQYGDGFPAPADPDDSTGYPELSQHTVQDTVTRFARLLADNGITVTGDPSASAAPEGASPIASVSSATLGEILAYTLQHSDNTLAEEFGRLTALAAGAGNGPEVGVQAVRSALEKLGIDTAGLAMADCSGLSDGSRLTVHTLVAVQQRNLHEGVGAAAAEGLSVVGLTGTAAYRYTDEKVAGLIRVKTGSLAHVTSMAGNVSRLDGGVLAFAVVVNNPDDYEAARNAIDVFVTGLARL
ncbi:D-alanyl-D-alanine carboxypeptidase [Bifidobacterium sp. UTBIF-68]|uniref:D-alanyl-D-alanine carboxypeptidase/D-alanyl-D-alanine-endopeptidase n=1 Tax=Bifidobacterium sp. UTBIF-68 TaxID=1465262 RepID=UPI00112618D0|nr:D-alanyl-D-alanine carboxypeptidase [Bifidobacterium sp. UTBIF-68]TPF94740.1 D-alanyl-D-alanine carboxypeptidase [Bifidobacterium sp. UTBIF-68]